MLDHAARSAWLARSFHAGRWLQKPST